MNYTIMVLAAYAVIMIAATVLMTNKEKSVERFCVGNRNTGWFISALSIAATWIWAPALFTSTENAYTKGFAGLFWFLVPNVLCLIFFIPFARRIRKEMPEGITLSGYMHQKYQSESVKNIYLFQLGALSALSTGVQLLAGSKILSMLTGIPFWIMTVIMAVIAYSYSQFSGIKASILTDSIQMVFMLIASVCFAVFGIKNGGGLQNMFAGIGGYTGECSSLFSAKGIEIFLGFGLPTTVGLISGPFGDQCFWQRAFCVKKNRIGRAFFVGAILFGMVPLSMGILGFVGAGMGYTAIDTGVINFWCFELSPQEAEKTPYAAEGCRTEWEYLSRILQHSGVPRRAILREDRATYTYENAIYSRAALDAAGITVKKAILCCQAFHARRALMYYQEQFPETEFVVCPVVTRGIDRDTWMKTGEGIDTVLGEVERCGSQFHEILREHWMDRV